jgi:hypothetical protein
VCSARCVAPPSATRAPSICFHVQPGNYDTDTLIGVLAELRRFPGGEKATLL